MAMLSPLASRAAAARPSTRTAAPLTAPQRPDVRARVSSNDFKNGTTILIDGVPFRVVEFMHVKPGKGAAFVRTKIKNCLTGATQERTFRAAENVPDAVVTRREAQFTYAEGEEYVFMDQESYEETRVPKDEDWARFLKEGAICSLQFFEGKVVSVDPPSFVDLAVTECPPNVKGNTVQGGSKPATLETGAVISVPLFIEEGEVIKIDTRTGSYLSRGGK